MICYCSILLNWSPWQLTLKTTRTSIEFISCTTTLSGFYRNVYFAGSVRWDDSNNWESDNLGFTDLALLYVSHVELKLKVQHLTKIFSCWWLRCKRAKRNTWGSWSLLPTCHKPKQVGRSIQESSQGQGGDFCPWWGHRKAMDGGRATALAVIQLSHSPHKPKHNLTFLWINYFYFYCTY